MTQAELERKIADIEQTANKMKKAVYQVFAETNSKYKIGDIVADANNTIKIEYISYSFFAKDIIYSGTILTKSGKPRKDGAIYTIFESAINKY